MVKRRGAAGPCRQWTPVLQSPPRSFAMAESTLNRSCIHVVLVRSTRKSFCAVRAAYMHVGAHRVELPRYIAPVHAMLHTGMRRKPDQRRVYATIPIMSMHVAVWPCVEVVKQRIHSIQGASQGAAATRSYITAYKHGRSAGKLPGVVPGVLASRLVLFVLGSRAVT